MNELIDQDQSSKKESKYNSEAFITDKIRWFVYALFFVSFLFHFLHWPGAGIGLIITAGASAFLIIGTITEGILYKNVGKALLNCSIHFAFVFLVFKLFYWREAFFPLLFIALTFMVGNILYRRKSKSRALSGKSILVFAIMIFCFYFQKLPSSTLYYAMGLTETFHKESHDHGILSWDIYAKHLYNEGKNELALKALDRAMENALENGTTEDFRMIVKHRRFIHENKRVRR